MGLRVVGSTGKGCGISGCVVLWVYLRAIRHPQAGLLEFAAVVTTPS